MIVGSGELCYCPIDYVYGIFFYGVFYYAILGAATVSLLLTSVLGILLICARKYKIGNRSFTLSESTVNPPTLFNWKSFLFWMIPLVILVSLLLMGSFFVDKFDASVDLKVFNWPTAIFALVWYSSGMFLIAAITYSCWWYSLSRHGVCNSALYAASAWLLIHALWYIAMSFINYDLALMHDTLVANDGVSTPFVRNYSGIVWSAIIALFGIASAIIVSLRSDSHSLPWICLAFATPFVIASWQFEEIQNLFSLDMFHSMSIFGIALSIRYSQLRRYGWRDEEDRQWFAGRILPQLRRNLPVILLLAALNLALLYGYRFTPISEAHDWIQFLLRMLFVFTLNVAAYLMLRKRCGPLHALQWTAVSALVSLAIVEWPPENIIFSPDSAQMIGIHIISVTIPVGLTAAAALIFTLATGIGATIRPYLIGTLCAPLMILSFAYPPAGFDLIYWIEPTIILIVIFAIMYGVFGPGRLTRHPDLKVDAASSTVQTRHALNPPPSNVFP